MIFTLAVAGLLVASQSSNDPGILLLGFAAGGVIGIVAKTISHRATAARNFAGPPSLLRRFADVMRGFAANMSRIALAFTIIISVLFFLSLLKLGANDPTMLFSKIAACFGSSLAFFSCLFGLFVTVLIDDEWFGLAQRFRANLAFGLLVGLMIPTLYLRNDVLPAVQKLLGL